MPVLRAVARPLLASAFITQGYENLLHPDRTAAQAGPVVKSLAKRVTAVPDDTVTALRIDGAVQLVAGSLLALGRFPRLSALALAATVVPTTLAEHRFWETDDKQERAEQRAHFLKDLALLGGLLIASADTAGNPSLAWRGRNAAKSAKHDVVLATKTAKVSGKAGAKAGAKAGRAAAKAERARRSLPAG